LKRDAALKAMAKHDISQRRACRLVSVDPKTVRREPEPDNPEVRARMRDIAGERRRFGYRRIGLMLEREGNEMNHKKLRRLDREEGLAVKRLRDRKRATGTREPMALPSGPTKRWSLDFFADTFGASRRFRILAVIDDYTRECLALVAHTSRSGGRVARELDAVIRLYGKPDLVVSNRRQGEHPGYPRQRASSNSIPWILRIMRSAPGGSRLVITMAAV
jgi:putative transposase